MPFAPSLAVTTVMHELRVRRLVVVATERIGPRMQRVTLGGPDLEPDFPMPPLSVADHVKIVLPDAATGEVTVPGIENDRLVRLQDIPTAVRDYTVRAVDGRGLVLDFVLHAHGPAGQWAGAAQIGQPLGVLGPRGSHLFPDGYDRYLLFADETAMPAVGRWLDEPSLTAPVTVHALVQSPDEYPLPDRADTNIVWHELPLGAERLHLMEVLAAGADLTGGSYVWAAGEANSLKPLRRALKAAGADRSSYHIDGYWRQGTAGLDHHLSDDDD